MKKLIRFYPKTIEKWKAPISPDSFREKSNIDKTLNIFVTILIWVYTTLMVFTMFASKGFFGEIGLIGMLRSLLGSALISTLFLGFFCLLFISSYLRPKIYLKKFLKRSYIKISHIPFFNTEYIFMLGILGYFFTIQERKGVCYDCVILVTRGEANKHFTLPFKGNDLKCSIKLFLSANNIQQPGYPQS